MPLGSTFLASIMILTYSYRKMNISRFFPYKCIRNQILPCCKVGQGQPRIIICAILVGPIGLVVSEKTMFENIDATPV